MKILLFVVFVTAAVLGSGIKEEMDKFAEECAKENNVDLSVFKTEEKLDMKIFDKRDYKCFGQCVALKSGMIDENGDPVIDKIKENFHLDDNSIDIMKKCAEDNKTVEDKCDKNFKINECVLKKTKAERK